MKHNKRHSADEIEDLLAQHRQLELMIEWLDGEIRKMKDRDLP